MNKNIVLIGFMACGKGRVARELSRKTGRFALDCDDLIESSANMKIRKIFAVHGESHFRDLELKTAKWLQYNVTNSIVSTGGGFVNVPNLKAIGHVVYLNGDFDYIVNEVFSHPKAEKKIKKRPLLHDLKKARELYISRLPVYRNVADLEITVTDRPVDDVADEIIKALDIS